MYSLLLFLYKKRVGLLMNEVTINKKIDQMCMYFAKVSNISNYLMLI